jgi:hypothetical protein
LSLKYPEYAILLTGKWGCGKTYFIDEFIKNHNKPSSDNKIKFIKISLFGLKYINAIDEQIFQNLHPVLASKYAKLTGNILKSALKLGISIDLDGDGKNEGSLSTSFDRFNPLELLKGKSEKNKEIVFIFDDLERTEINTKEVLGYINYLVEQASFKVIIVANEDKLTKKDSGTYLEFKEKVIGKTFEVRHDFSEVLTQFLEDHPINLGEFDQTIVENVYALAGYKNLRHIKQSIIDFTYLTKNISNKYTNDKNFLSDLTFTFFALNIEVKTGSLDEKDFSTYNWIFEVHLNDDKSKESATYKILKKYKLDSDLLFSPSDWINILYKSHIETEELNERISNLTFFMEKGEKPSWVKLWSFSDLKEAEFDDLLKDVTYKFKNCAYDSPELFMHAIALLVYFNQENLSDYSLVNIKKNVKNCLSGCYKQSDIWKSKLLGNNKMFNSTGLGYMNSGDSNFLDIFKIVEVASKNIYNANITDKKTLSLTKFIESIKNGDIKFIKDILLGNNKFSPFFDELSPEKFFSTIFESTNKNFYDVSKIINSRYSDDTILEGKGYEHHLLDELLFWQNLNKKLESFDYSNHKIKSFNLKQFKKHIIDRIIAKMEGTNK